MPLQQHWMRADRLDKGRNTRYSDMLVLCPLLKMRLHLADMSCHFNTNLPDISSACTYTQRQAAAELALSLCHTRIPIGKKRGPTGTQIAKAKGHPSS